MISCLRMRRDGVTLFLLLFIAALARWADLGRSIQFAYDEGDLSLMALDLIHKGEIPLLGVPSSVGVRNSPMTVYMVALFYLLTSSPVVVTGLIALFNVLGVGIWWAILRRVSNARVAALSAMLYALSPYAIHYSRKIWAQDYHTPVILAGVGLGIRGFWDGKRWAQVTCLPVLVLGLQIHFAAWTLLPLWGVLVLTAWRRVDWRALAISVLLAALTLIPFMIGVQRADETGSMAERIDIMRAAIDGGIVLRDEPVRYVVRLLVGNGTAFGPQADQAAILARLPDFTLWWRALALLALPGALALWRRKQPDARRMALLVTVWIVVPVLFFIPDVTGSWVYRSYFVPLLPVLALLVGLGADAVLRVLSGHAVLRTVFVTVVGLIALSGTWWYYGMLGIVGTVTPRTSRLDVPMHYLLEVRDTLRSADAAGEDVVLVNPQRATSQYEVWHALLYHSAACVREIDPGHGMRLVPAGAFTAVLPPSASPNTALAQRYVADPDATVPLRPGEGSYLIRRHSVESTADWNQEFAFDVSGPAGEPLARFENGTQLLAVSKAPEGNPERLFVVWQLPGPRPKDRGVDIGGLRFYFHAFDAAGQRVAQRDIVFWPRHFWCAGDRLIYRVDLALPNQVAVLRAGQYMLSEDQTLSAVNVIGAAGQPLAGWVELPMERLD